VPITVPDW